MEFNVEIFKIISRSKLNETLGFLDKDRIVDLKILNDYLVNIGLIDTFFHNQLNLDFFTLIWKITRTLTIF